MIWRVVGSVLGFVLIVIGLPLMISPIPLGIILIFLGFVTLIGSNPMVARLVQKWRRRHATVNEFFHKAEEVLPDPIAEPLHETDIGDPGEKASAADEPPPMMRKIREPRRLR